MTITLEEYHGNLPLEAHRLLPPGTQFGFNTSDEQAWMVAERGPDLVPYLERVRRDASHREPAHTLDLFSAASNQKLLLSAARGSKRCGPGTSMRVYPGN